MNPNPVVVLKAKRPRWWRAAADLVFDGRAAGPDMRPLFKTVLDKVELLAPGRTLSFRLCYEPVLLCRVLDQMRFEHWAERQNDGDWRIDVSPSRSRGRS